MSNEDLIKKAREIKRELITSLARAIEIKEKDLFKEVKSIDDLIEIDKEGHFYYCLNGKMGIYKPKYIESWFKNFIGFLNEACEIREEDKFYSYLDEMSPYIDKITGLKSNKNLQILEYGSGKRCIYDIANYHFNNTGLYGYCEIFSDVIASSKRKSVKDLLTLPLILPLRLLWFRKTLNFLSKRIMGQYDVNIFSFLHISPAATEGKIRIVSPNIRKFAKKRNHKLEDLEKYVVMHEDIHHRQAVNFPDIESERQKLLKRSVLCALIEAHGGIKEVSVKEAKKIGKESWDRLMALMSTLEGHSEFFSNKVAEVTLPDFEFKRRRDFIAKLKTRLYGLKEKMEQYERGSEFIQCLYKRGGTELANLPLQVYPMSMQEIRDPEKYLQRVKLLNLSQE